MNQLARRPPTKWRPEWDALLGTKPDTALARDLGVAWHTVANHRHVAGVRPFTRKQPVKCSTCPQMTKKYRANKDSQCRTCRKKYLANWHTEHKEARNEARRQWYLAHPEQHKAAVAAWQKSHRLERAEHLRRYRKREKERNLSLIASLPCLDCGMFHTAETRQRVIRRMLPCATIEIHDAWPCFFGNGGQENKGSAGTQRLLRDLKAIGATRTGHTWHEQRAEVAA